MLADETTSKAAMLLLLMMERVKKAIANNAKLAEESAWLWLASEQMGFPFRPTGGEKHEERA